MVSNAIQYHPLYPDRKLTFSSRAPRNPARANFHPTPSKFLPITMGNCCSSSKEPEAFSGPGRVVGAPSSPSAPRAPLPTKNWKNTPGRTLGESSETPGGADEARSNAAIAAQVRSIPSRPGPGLLKRVRSEVGTSGIVNTRIYRSAPKKPHRIRAN